MLHSYKRVNQPVIHAIDFLLKIMFESKYEYMLGHLGAVWLYICRQTPIQLVRIL